MPVPVPRHGAGNTSGVYEYKTPYITFYSKSARREHVIHRIQTLTWKKASIEEQMV